MATLSMAERRNMSSGDFAIPEKAPGSGSYPIKDRNHARIALTDASGKPEEGRVRAAVKKKYPDMGVEGSPKEEAAESDAEAKAEGDKPRGKKMSTSQRMNAHMRFKAGVKAY